MPWGRNARTLAEAIALLLHTSKNKGKAKTKTAVRLSRDQAARGQVVGTIGAGCATCLNYLCFSPPFISALERRAIGALFPH